MRILNLEQFMAIEGECVFAKYRPHACEALAIKVPWSSTTDFLFQDLDPVGALNSDGSGDCFDKLTAMVEDSDLDGSIDLQQYQRDGMYDKEQLFIVFSDADVEKLIERLQKVRDWPWGNER